MVRNKYSIDFRNKLANLAGWCDSCAAIEGAKMTKAERQVLQQKLRDTVFWIDKKLGF